MSIFIVICYSVQVPWFRIIQLWIQCLMVYNIKNIKLILGAFVPKKFLMLNRYHFLHKHIIYNLEVVICKDIVSKFVKVLKEIVMYCNIQSFEKDQCSFRGRHGHYYMAFGFTTTCTISAYHHWSCEFEPHWRWGVLDTTLCDKICQWLAATGQWFPAGTLVSSTNKLTATIYM